VVIENASGEPFLDYTQANVFDLLDMKNTHAEQKNLIGAHARLKRIEKILTETNNQLLEARFHAIRAEYKIESDELVEAEKSLNLSFVTFEKTGLVFEKALCRIKEAKIALKRNEKEIYLTSLNDARNIFLEMGADYFERNSDKMVKGKD
jgi:flagellin-specific chaperone FliS